MVYFVKYIRGNHSTTQYPGLEGATVDGQKIVLD